MPDTEPVVARWHERFDRPAAEGMPVHITAPFLFLPPNRLTAGVLAKLREICPTPPVLGVEFATTSRFPDHMYLEPQPAGELIALTEAIAASWPETPPYGGVFPHIVPHLTVAGGIHEEAARDRGGHSPPTTDQDPPQPRLPLHLRRRTLASGGEFPVYARRLTQARLYGSSRWLPLRRPGDTRDEAATPRAKLACRCKVRDPSAAIDAGLDAAMVAGRSVTEGRESRAGLRSGGNDGVNRPHCDKAFAWVDDATGVRSGAGCVVAQSVPRSASQTLS